MSANEEYQGGEAVNDDYVNRPGQDGGVPVVSDKNTADEGGYTNPEQADSDAQLQKDDTDAIDQSNIIEERTRGARPEGGYAEPGDEEGLGGPDDGRSAVAGGPN